MNKSKAKSKINSNDELEMDRKLEDARIADWIYALSQGNVEFTTNPRLRKKTKSEFYQSSK